jgi:hypothetical protein
MDTNNDIQSWTCDGDLIVCRHISLEGRIETIATLLLNSFAQGRPPWLRAGGPATQIYSALLVVFDDLRAFLDANCRRQANQAQVRLT